MLFIYHGDNVSARKQATDKLRQQLLKKRPEAEIFDIDADEFSVGRLQELTGGRGLFEDKYIVFLFHVLTIEVGQEAVIDRAEHLAAAEHVFVLIEDELEKKHKKKLEEHAKHLKEFAGGEAEEEFKPWPLSDAYGNRKRSAAWIELQKAKIAGQKPEAIQGVLAWQTRLMLLAKECETAEEAGESGYPFKKAKGFSKNFSRSELEQNFSRLVTGYHEAHRGTYDLDNFLEQFLLEL